MHTCLVFLVGWEVGTEMLYRESVNNKDGNYKRTKSNPTYYYINKQVKRKFPMALSAKPSSVLCLRHMQSTGR